MHFTKHFKNPKDVESKTVQLLRRMCHIYYKAPQNSFLFPFGFLSPRLTSVRYVPRSEQSNWTDYNQNWINKGKCLSVKANRTEGKDK